MSYAPILYFMVGGMVGAMPKIAKELSEVSIRRLKHTHNSSGEPYKAVHPVGGVSGLYLQCFPPVASKKVGAKTWLFRAVIGNKRRWIGLGKIKTDMGTLSLNHGDTVRIRKKLPLALDEMLKELQDETFVRLIKQLNSLGFSPYDCIYSYNQLLFMENRVNKKGVSFFQFDTEDSICAIQHHFERGIHSGDRFEITTSLGERRLVCSKF